MDLALNLVLDTLATGVRCDPGLAVMGKLPDVPSEQELGPVDSLDRKLRESVGKVSLAVVPGANRDDLTDLLLTDGWLLFVRLPVLTVETLDDARRIAPAVESRDGFLNEALRLFGEVRAELGGNPRVEALRQPAIRLRLLKILELEPGHASARMLLAVAEKRLPTRLSLRGSLRLFQRAETVLALKHPDALFAAASAMNRQRPLLVPEVQSVWDPLAARLEAKRRLLAQPSAEWKAKEGQAAQAFQVTSAALAVIPEVREARERLGREP